MTSLLRRRFAKAASAAFATFEVAVLALIWTACLPAVAYAYVDPSVMTYTIQALAGVAVALSAVAGVVFRRVRRKMMIALNIDENANKAVEGEIHRIDPAGPDAFTKFHEGDEHARKLYEESCANTETRGLASLTWPRRLAFSILMCAFAFFIILVAPAIEIFGSNSDSLVFGIGKVWWVTALINGAFAVACAFALSALKGRHFMRAMLFVFCLAIAAYVQSFFMNKGMMPADGGFIGWDEWYFVKKMISSGIVWLLILIVPQIACRKHQYSWLRATSVIAVCVIIMQGVGVASVAIEAGEHSLEDGRQPYVTQGGLYELHPESNVIVFVLDAFDTSTLDTLRGEDPSLLANFTDFTYFRNSAGAMIPTMNAIPFLLTAETPEPGEDIGEFRKSRYERGRLIPAISEAGYSVDIFTDSAMWDYNSPADAEVARIAGNVHPMDRVPMNVWETYVAMDQCALYREAPWVLKPLFWYYTTEVNNRMIGVGDTDDAHNELYELDDAGILATLRENGLSVSDEQVVLDGADSNASKGAFKFIHLFGPHFPYSVDEEGIDVGVGKSNLQRQAKGSLRVVDQYLTELKKLGLYDGATIIVTADHGIWDEREDPVKHPPSPIMLVKPSVAEGEGGAELVVSDAPISHTDFAPTVLQAVGADPSGFGSGMTVWDVVDDGRVRYFNALTSAGEGGRRFVEYKIDGMAIDLESWSKTGQEWPGA